MFGWIARRVRRDRDGYRDRERRIFVYHDGLASRRADPLELHRRLTSSTVFDFDADPLLARVPTAEGAAAWERTIAGIRDAFGIKPFAEGGLLEEECVELFERFAALVRELCEGARPLASGPAATAAGHPVNAGSTTPSTAASGLTGSAQPKPD